MQTLPLTFVVEVPSNMPLIQKKYDNKITSYEMYANRIPICRGRGCLQ